VWVSLKADLQEMGLRTDHYDLYFRRSSTSVNSLLIRHARILLADGNWLTGDVLVRGERIVEIAAEITVNDLTKQIDATGLVLLPGIIDPQVHFREPGLEHQEDLAACAKGGVTSFTAALQQLW
jgi:dihydroorotase